MSDMADVAKVLAKLTVMVNALSAMSFDTIVIAMAALPRCYAPGCNRPQMVTHAVIDHMKVCDRHCAELIVLSKSKGNQFTIEEMKSADVTEKDLKDMNILLSEESLWRDVPFAESIRKIDEHVRSLIGRAAVIH